jgi:ketosteroid isomerase-like protein
MEQSPELKAATLRYYDAVSKGDAASMSRLLSNQSDVAVIGTDPNEWWTDLPAVKQALKAQTGVKMLPGDISAYREGSVGWVADRGKLVATDGTEVPIRWTAVFHQEGGEWKLVQGHASIGVPNDEALAKAKH